MSLDIQNILNADDYSNVNTNVNNINTNRGMHASPITLTNVLYKITGQGKFNSAHNTTNDFYIPELKHLPISRKHGGYEIVINKAVVRGGRKKALVQILPDKNMQNLRGQHKEMPNLVELSVLVKKGNDEVGGSIVVYYTGVVTITMGVLGDGTVDNTIRRSLLAQVEAVKVGVIQSLFPFVKGTGAFANITGQFKFDKTLNPERLNSGLSLMKGVSDISPYNPEMSLAAVRFMINGIKCAIFPNSGMCQMFKATKIDQLTATRDALLTETQTGALFSAVGGPSIAKVGSKVIGKAKKLVLNKRAPGVVRVGKLCPVARRPNAKTGKCPSERQYKRPNEQGDMCCYKIPKLKTKKFKQMVAQSYKNFNKKLPRNLQIELDISDADINAADIETELLAQFVISENGRMRIKKRLCTSYTKSELGEFATRIGLIVDPTKSTFDTCTAIHQEWRRRIGAGGGLNKINILANQRGGFLNLKIEDRKCKYWSRKNLVKWAKDHGIIVNSKLKKMAVCKLLFERANKNSKFNSEIGNRRPVIKVVNGQVLIHNRNVSSYSNKFLTHVAKKLKIPATSKSDIIRKMYVKYVVKPKITVGPGGKLRLMNRNIGTFNKAELREIAKKIPNVKNTGNPEHDIFMTTAEGQFSRLNKMPKNLHRVLKAPTFLSPEERITVVNTFVNASTSAKREREQKLRRLKNRLTKVKRNLNYYNYNTNRNINNILNMNDEDDLRSEARSLKGKMKRAETRDDTEERIITTIYDKLSKQKGFESRYLRIARANNINMGAVSLAKTNIERIVSELMKKNKRKSPPKQIKKSPTKTKVKSLTIEWFVNGNRKAIKVVANANANIEELASKGRKVNMVSKITDRTNKKATVYFKEPLAKTTDANKAVRVAEKKIRAILKRKV